MTTIETRIAKDNSKVDTANETARLAELKAEYDNLTDALLNDENISDSRDDYLRKLRADVRSEMKEIEAAIEAENSTAVATTYTTKVAKNGAINFYNVETGKRVKEADIVAEAIENDGIFYAASVHGYGVDHFCSKEFASPITAYKWICRMARKSNTYADGDACITVGFFGELIYTQKHSVNEIKNAELRAYVEAEMAEQIAEDDNNEREDLIHAQMHNNNLTREQAEQITDYLRANRQNYNAEIAATAKAMLDMFKKINNPETEDDETTTVEINNVAEYTPASVEEKAEVVIPIVDYRTLLTWAEKVSNGQHDTAIQIVTHIKKWFNAETDKKTVIEVIKAGDLNGFRNFLCQFNFVVKDDGGCIHKLYRYDNGECVLAEIPTSEYAKYSVEETEAELPSGNVTVNSGAEAWAIVGKYFPKGNLEFYRAGKGFNNEDTFCYTLDEIIYVHVTCTPDNKRVKCIEIVNTYEESESERNILTVYIKPATDEELDKQFALYRASGKAFYALNLALRGVPFGAERKQAKKTLDDAFNRFNEKARAFEDSATEIYGKLEEQVQRATEERLHKVSAQVKAMVDAAIDKTHIKDSLTRELIERYKEHEANQPAEVKALNAELAASNLQAPCMWVRIVDDGIHRGSFSRGVLNATRVDYDEYNGYGVYYFDEPMGLYDTFAQAKTAVEQFKAAITNNAEAFTFPTIADLTPPEPKMTATAVEETDRERFLKASEYVITSLGRYLGTDKFGEDRFAVTWKTRCPLRKINKATARNILATFGLTTDAYLAEKAKWVADEIKRGSRQFAIDMQAEFLRDKIAADSKASVEPMPTLYPVEDSDDDDELIDTPVKAVDAAHISDSLTRAMKTALEKFQGFCLVKNLTAAENELKLYNICREATRELWGVTA